MNKRHQPAETGSTLQAYERCLEKWRRWLRDDPHQALWPQIYSMLLADMTFRSIAAAAEADPESALHSPILVRAITAGYASDHPRRNVTDCTRVAADRAADHLVDREGAAETAGGCRLPLRQPRGNGGRQAECARVAGAGAAEGKR